MKTHVTINNHKINLSLGAASSTDVMGALNSILLALDGVTFEKKEEEKPWSHGDLKKRETKS